MRHRGILAFVFFMSALVPAQSGAEAAPLKAPTIPIVKKGLKLQYEEVTEVTRVVEFGETTQKIQLTVHSLETREVLDVKKDGSWKIKVSNGRRHGSITMDDKTIDFDSAKPNTDPVIQQLLEGVAKAYVGTVSPVGVLKDWKTVGEQGELIPTDKHTLNLAQFYLVQYPKEKLAESITWEPTVAVHHCVADGCISFKTKCKLAKVSAASLTIETACGEKQAKFLSSVDTADLASAKPGTMKRIVELSREDGFPIRLQALGLDVQKIDGGSMSVRSRITMTRKR